MYFLFVRWEIGKSYAHLLMYVIVQQAYLYTCMH